MDQEKIGKLIAKLRNQLGLTQSELGAKVGVGDRAVSKWERGITCPDISIINELSKILGITSDELLNGELSSNHQTPKSKKKPILLIILSAVMLLSIIGLLFLINTQNKDKTYAYRLESDDSNYSVNGNIVFDNEKVSVIITNFVIRNKEVNKIDIKNYEYSLRTNNELILRYGYINKDDFEFEPVTIKQLLKTLKINYKRNQTIDYREIIKNGLIFKITFVSTNNEIIEHEFDIKLKQLNK